MNYINYLDLPSVPEHLLDTVSSILASPNISKITQRDFFQQRSANSELIQWAEENIHGVPFKFKAQYQVIGYGIPIHRDVAYRGGNARSLAINYILDTGGNDVRTVIYDDSKNILESQVIQPMRWHSIQVNMLHCVLGLVPGKFRVTLSLGLNEI